MASPRAPETATSSSSLPKERFCTDCERVLPNQIAYERIESILSSMQDEHSGLPVKTAKSFMSKIPSVFTGAELIQWMMRNLRLEDQQEAIHLANLIASYGYIFPIEDHTLSIKNDCTFYRFQTPCLWPSKNQEPENTDYAVYLCKRTMQGKTRLELADYEAENLARLQKMFSRKWEFIFMQAEAQAKVDKKRDKLERKVLDSQERAFWDVYRPVPGSVNTTELDIKKACRLSKSVKRCPDCQKDAPQTQQATPACGRSAPKGTQGTVISTLKEESEDQRTSSAQVAVKPTSEPEAKSQPQLQSHTQCELQSSVSPGNKNKATEESTQTTSESNIKSKCEKSRGEEQVEKEEQDLGVEVKKSPLGSSSSPEVPAATKDAPSEGVVEQLSADCPTTVDDNNKIAIGAAGPHQTAGHHHHHHTHAHSHPHSHSRAHHSHHHSHHPSSDGAGHHHSHNITHMHTHHGHGHAHHHHHPHQHQHQHQHHSRNCPHHRSNQNKHKTSSQRNSQSSLGNPETTQQSSSSSENQASTSKGAATFSDNPTAASQQEAAAAVADKGAKKLADADREEAGLLGAADQLGALKPTARSAPSERPKSACDSSSSNSLQKQQTQAASHGTGGLQRKSSLNAISAVVDQGCANNRTPATTVNKSERSAGVESSAGQTGRKGSIQMMPANGNTISSIGALSTTGGQLIANQLELLKLGTHSLGGSSGRAQTQAQVNSIASGAIKMNKVTESYVSYFNQWAEYDPFIEQPIPSNPWVSDSCELWDSERQTKDVHCRRVRRWAFSLKELLNDPAGREQFYKFLEKEFSAENLKFWDAVQELKRVHSRDVGRKVEAIWKEYLAQDANCPINIDSKSYETSKRNMAKNRTNRYIFDEAAGHVYQLMKNDSYPRYLRSEMYKDYREQSEKRRTNQNQVTFDVFKPQISNLKQRFNF